MPAPPASFRATLLIVWLFLIAGGAGYARQQDIPARVAAAAIGALAVEAAFYLLPGFEASRERLARLARPGIVAWILVGSAAAPYLVASLGAIQFRFENLLGVVALAAVATLWYPLLGRGTAADFLFLAFVGTVTLSRLFPALYPSNMPKLPLDILGRLMWIRLGILAVLLFRRMDGIGFGFLPRAREWLIGGLCYLAMLPLLLPLAFASGFVRRAAWHPDWKVALVAAATFAGMLWGVALAEEFFFRGLLQQWLSGLFSSRAAGLVAAAVVFGLVHLPFRGFPNWRFAALAAVAGVSYGVAFEKGGGIRAAMVTHALLNTTWRVLFN